MIKYELKENSVEVRKKDLAKGCAVEDMNADPKIIKSFDKKEEALNELKKYKTDVYDFSSPVGAMCNVTEYYVEENEYDEDNEWISGGDIWEISEIK